MALILILGACGVMALSYLLTTFYRRRRDGIQPSYTALPIMVITVGCFALAFYILRRFGFDLQHRPPRFILWLVLSIMWLVLAIWTVYQRRISGTVLMDLGPAPMFKFWMGVAVFGGVLAISLAITGPRAEAFAFGAQSALLFVGARDRFEVRDHGVILPPHHGFLPWNRIAGCVAADDNIVRLHLNKSLRRTLDIRLPPDRRDGFIQLVNARKGVKIDPHLLNP